MLNAATVNAISTVHYIGIVYDTLPMNMYTPCCIVQCQNCPATFIREEQAGEIYCHRCRANKLRKPIGWRHVRQLQRIAAPYMMKDEYVKPKRERTSEDWRQRLLKGFKQEGALTASQICKLTFMGSAKAIRLMAFEGVFIVPVGVRRSITGRTVTEYAVTD